jgi:hypothetical protein
LQEDSVCLQSLLALPASRRPHVNLLRRTKVSNDIVQTLIRLRVLSSTNVGNGFVEGPLYRELSRVIWLVVGVPAQHQVRIPPTQASRFTNARKYNKRSTGRWVSCDRCARMYTGDSHALLLVVMCLERFPGGSVPECIEGIRV